MSVRLLLDTDVIIAAMRSPQGGSAELLRQIVSGRATMLLSVALALEYEANCTMAEHRILAGFTLTEAGSFVDGLSALAELVHSAYRWRPQLRDPGDELVLKAAVNGRTTAIVTFNEKDLRNARLSFGIDVIRPSEALRRIRSWQPE